jgi:preprotein translocase subunit SecF
MELFKQQTSFDFMGKRKLAMLFSAALIVISIAALATQKLNFGIDFTGGHIVEVGYSDSVELPGIRDALTAAGYDDAIVQYFGTSRDVLIRLAPRDNVNSAQLSSQILKILRQHNAEVELRRVEFVGPQVGDELTQQGGMAMLWALGGIMVYIWLRFLGWQFALGAVVALAHDVIITLGVFSVSQMEFDLTVLAALLAVIGYSLNDTIVVFDRIRENFRRMRTGDRVEIINTSLNQTLSRTLMTSVTTLLVLIALFVWGGELIHGFATALIVGIVVGTYSSIYVASNALVQFKINKADLMPVKKEGVEADRP